MASLAKLSAKLKRRRRARRKQTRRWRRTRKRGHARTAKRHARAVRYLRKRYATLKERLKKFRRIAPGPPSWGGSAAILLEEVDPIVAGRNISPTSSKRSETFGNPSSDHFIGNLLAYARDYATSNNQDLANTIRQRLTRNPSAVHRDYENFYIERRGYTYRVQIIASTHGTGPHLHIGIRRVS